MQKIYNRFKKIKNCKKEKRKKVKKEKGTKKGKLHRTAEIQCRGTGL